MNNHSNIFFTKVLFFTLLIYLSVFIAVFCVTSYDAYWHIKVGEWVFEHKMAPDTGIFSYTKNNSQWISHEWLSALLMYLIFNVSGWDGLVIMTILSITLTMLLMTNHTLKYVNANIAIIFMLFAYYLLLPHIMPRPHILALPIMVFWTIQLINASDNKTRPSLFLLPVMVLWGNMHGSFILGIAFCFFFATECIVKAQTTTKRISLAKKWGLFTALSILSVLLNPHGINTYLLPLQLTNQEYAISIISEWASPNFHHLQPLEVWLLTLLTLCFTLGIKLPLFRMIFILGLIHLSLKHIRHAADLLSFLPPLVLAQPLAEQLKIKPNFSLKQILSIQKRYWFYLSLLTIILITLINSNRIIESEENIQLGKVLKVLSPDKLALGNILNGYGSGGHLIHYGYQTFIDTRAELYGDKFIKSYFEAVNLERDPKKLEQLLQRYNIQWTFFETYLPVNAYLETKQNWSKLYQDRFTTLFIKNTVKLEEKTKLQIKQLSTEARSNKKLSLPAEK